MMISIITPLYNSEKFIGDAIESVLLQNYTDWEMIIVDDCSMDGSVDIVKEYIEQDNRIKLVVFEKNRGQAVARNVALGLAKGRYVAFLDSDDVWLPNKLEIQYAFMEKTGAVMSCTSYQKIYENGKYGCVIRPKSEVTYHDILKTNSIGCSTVMYDLYQVGDLRMEVMKTNEDYTLWLKILKEGYMVYGLSDILALYRVRDNSISSNKLNAAINQWRIYRSVERLNFFCSLYYFFWYAVNGLKKYIL